MTVNGLPGRHLVTLEVAGRGVLPPAALGRFAGGIDFRTPAARNANEV